MKCLVLLSIFLVVPAIFGQPTRTKTGTRPRRLMAPPPPAGGPPPPAGGPVPPPSAGGPAPPPPPPYAAAPPPPAGGRMPPRHPAVLRQQNVLPPAPPRNDIKDVPDNFRAAVPPPPRYIPPGAPADRMAPNPGYRVVPAPPNVPPTRTKTLGMLRPLPPAAPFDPFMPMAPATGYPTTTNGWINYPTDYPEVKKEEEESR